MKKGALVLSILLAALMAMPHVTPAQRMSEDDLAWYSARQRASEAEKIIVVLKNGKRLEGPFLHSSEARLTLSQQGQSVNVARREVQRIYMEIGRPATVKDTFVGMGAGGIAGAVVGGIISSRSGVSKGVTLPASVATGVIVGALAGRAIGRRQKRRILIYPR